MIILWPVKYLYILYRKMMYYELVRNPCDKICFDGKSFFILNHIHFSNDLSM